MDFLILFIIQTILFLLLVIVPHELGHFIIAKMSNYSLEKISILFFRYDYSTKKMYFHWNIFENYIQATPNTIKNLTLYFSIGILINIIFGIIFIFLKDISLLFVILGIQSILVGLTNMIPCGFSDGHYLGMLLFPKLFPFKEEKH